MRWIATLGLLAMLMPACGGDDDDDDDDHHHADAAADSADADPAAPDAGPDTPDARPTGRIETRSYSFGNGNLIEGTLDMAEGDEFIWRIDSTGGEAFYNVHAHAGGRTTTYVQDEAVTVEYEFTAPHTGDFYFLLGNTSVAGTIDVDIEFELFGSAAVTDWGN